jgi:hypothetical protein
MKRSRRNRPLPSKQSGKDNSIPFHREISAVQLHCDQMSSALAWKDPSKVRSAACRVVRAWLHMEAAFIRFIERNPARLGLGAKAWQERSVLTGMNYLVRELFRCALDETASWAASPDELRALTIVLRWHHERLQLWSVIELPVLHP